MIPFIISLVYVLIREFLFIYERKQWQKERDKLLDRIQARDLPEFKKFDEPKKEEKKEEQPKYYEFL